MAIIHIEDEKCFNQANSVLKEINIDMTSVVNILLNKIISEKSIDFLIADSKKILDDLKENNNIYIHVINHDKSKTNNTKTYYSENKHYSKANNANKFDAIKLFRDKGYYLYNRNTTFASKNDTAYIYWANPDVKLLKDDWFLILNDNIKNKYYLFKIPKGELKFWDFKLRADQNNKIDLQIIYNDNYFTDSRSKIEFRKYLIDEATY